MLFPEKTWWKMRKKKFPVLQKRTWTLIKATVYSLTGNDRN